MAWKQGFFYPAIGILLKAGMRLASRARLPQTNGLIRIRGLGAPAEVIRDRWGVPHIYAQSAQDAVFAQGFVHAQDRLFQMDFTRRIVFGRLSEIVGEAGFPMDRAMRTVGLYKTAEAEVGLISGVYRDLISAYCAGINAWLEVAIERRKLPVEFMLLRYAPEPWQIKDTLAWGKLMAWTLAANWQTELYRRLLVEKIGLEKVAELEIASDQAWAVVLDLGLEMGGAKFTDATHPYAGPNVGEGVGSNNWVLHGRRTLTGKPLLANDMHLELTTPAIWYENHIIGGELDVTGVSLPGVPLVISGHNRQLAWGFTDSCADVQDLYEEHLRRSCMGGWEFEFQGGWFQAAVRKEVYRIKGRKTIEDDVVTTRHGPVINNLFSETFPGMPPMALHWTALEPDNSFQAIVKMNYARDCREFHEALRYFDNPSQNVVYADIDGNIGYTLNGRIPIRAKGDGTVPAPGWTGEYEWQGYIPFEELPHLSNPPRGYVATANNQIQRPDFPHFLGKDYVVSERAGRIIELIEAKETLDIPYFQTMQSDRLAISARLMARALGSLQVQDPVLQEIVNSMSTWEGRLEKDDPLATIFEATIREIGGLMVDHHMGEIGRRIRGDGPFSGHWPDHLWEWFVRLLDEPKSAWFDLGHGEERDDILRLGLQQAVNFLRKRLGPDWHKWEWGRLHQVTFTHRLGMQSPWDRVFGIGPFPIGGDGNTICAASSSFCNLEYCPVVGPPYRFIADLNDLDHCLGILVPGQSGHLASSHYSDGVEAWLEGKYHPVLYRREDVEQNMEASLELRPA